MHVGVFEDKTGDWDTCEEVGSTWTSKTYFSRLHKQNKPLRLLIPGKLTYLLCPFATPPNAVLGLPFWALIMAWITSFVFITPFGFSFGTRARLVEWIGSCCKGCNRLLLLRRVERWYMRELLFMGVIWEGRRIRVMKIGRNRHRSTNPLFYTIPEI